MEIIEKPKLKIVKKKTQPIPIPKKKSSFIDMCNIETSNHPYKYKM
jgi:hypothetical protein